LKPIRRRPSRRALSAEPGFASIVISALGARQKERRRAAKMRSVGRAGVRLDRYLGAGSASGGEGAAEGGEDALGLGERQEAGCAAAEEDGGGPGVVGHFAPEGHLGDKGVDVGRHQVFEPRVGVEVAVGALGLTEGDVYVEG
jgi:hypothetical protein